MSALLEKSAATLSHTASTLVFIDAGVEDPQFLANGVIDGAKAFILDSHRDGVKQITEILKDYPEVTSIHLVSHGSPGSIQLGNSYLSLDTLDRYQSQLENWFAQSLLIYGCNVAAGDAGEELTDKLHQLTGADIAASKTKTGSRILNGDWNLDVCFSNDKLSIGKTNKNLAFNRITVNSYQGILVSASPNQTLTGSGANWFITNNGGTTNSLPSGGSSSGGPGFTVQDANIPGQYDAFDNGVTLFVNNQQFVAPDTVDLTGSTLTAGPVPLSGLNTTVQYHADQSQPILRTFVGLENPTATPITINFTLATNMGSDGSTSVQATSSGDTNFTIDDRWVITDDSPTGGDPTNTHVLAGPDNPTVTSSAVSQTVFSASGTQGILSEYNVTIPANSTRSLLFFNGLASTSANAQANVAVFNDVATLYDTSLLDGLSAQQLAGVVNWSFLPSTTEDDVLDVDAPGILENFPGANNSVAGSDATSANGATVVVNPNGSYSYDPSGSQVLQSLAVGESLEDTFNFTLDNGAGNTSTEAQSIVVSGVNDAPEASPVEGGTTNEDAVNPFTFDLLATVTDIDTSDEHSVPDGATATSNNGDRTVAFTIVDGEFSLNPNQFNDLAVGESETITVNYEVSDGTATVPNTATFVVEGRNDAPTATAITADATNEDAGNPYTIDLLSTASDVDTSDEHSVPDGATVTSSNGDRTVNFTIVDGEFSLDPNQFNDLAVGESETITVNYEVSDGTAMVANTATFDVTGVNDAPVVANEIGGQAVNDTDAVSLDLSDNFEDPDTTDTLTFSAEGLPAGLEIDAAGMITGTATDSGVYEVTITANDLSESVSDTFELTVQGVITGTPGGDRLSANPQPNQIDGAGGNDRISGFASNDYLLGGEGDDSLKGGTENDLIEGNAGRDFLLGGKGMDTLAGGADNDLLKGGTQDDMLMGDAGLDRLYGNKGADTFVLQADMGLDTIHDFKPGEDILQLEDGFTGTLSLTESGRNTMINLVDGDTETAIALLKGVRDVTLESLNLAQA